RMRLPSSTTAAAVSSQELSIPKIFTFRHYSTCVILSALFEGKNEIARSHTSFYDYNKTSTEEIRMTTILLIRHGETDWNADKIFRGRADIELNENGIKQAELLAQYLAD